MGSVVLVDGRSSCLHVAGILDVKGSLGGNKLEMTAEEESEGSEWVSPPALRVGLLGF